MREKQIKLKENEQRTSAEAIFIGKEEREDFDSSTESKEIVQKELDQDMAIEDEMTQAHIKEAEWGKGKKWI